MSTKNRLYFKSKNFIKLILSLQIVLIIISCTSIKKNKTNRTTFFPKEELNIIKVPKKNNLWVFIMAGQSNMAGRGFVQPQDTIPNQRVLTINKKGDLIIAKEPLHFYESTMAGLDCALSFGNTLTKSIPDSISILLLPTAFGGSSISQWIGDSIHREVKLLSNFKEKVEIGMKYGHVKGVLWHQGESDANIENFAQYKNRLSKLTAEFRKIINNDKLTILIGELGGYANDELWLQINKQIKSFVNGYSNIMLIKTQDLKDRGDNLHFNSEGQRIMGVRFANEFLKMQN